MEIEAQKDDNKDGDKMLDLKETVDQARVMKGNQKIFRLQKHKEEKQKKGWDSWTKEEKVLFYEAIANGSTSASSLQNLFKTMKDVRTYLLTKKIGTKSTEKIRDYYYRAHKNVCLLLKNAGSDQINLKDKKEKLCVLKCYGKLVIDDKNKKSSKIDTLKNLNKHPRILKKVATHLNKMVVSKIKSLRKYKKKRELSSNDKNLIGNHNQLCHNQFSCSGIKEKAKELLVNENRVGNEKVSNETRNIDLEIRRYLIFNLTILIGSHLRNCL